MTRHLRSALAAALAIALAPTPQAQGQAAGPARGVTSADVRFMSGMIVHHEQAVLMARWAPTHDADPALQTLCKRIVISQLDEIGTMERWLREHGQPLPDTAWVFEPAMAGMAQPMLMPGMLTAAELARLDSARGPAFDRLFLEGMIRHHTGALSMVTDLLTTPGAGQDPFVFQYASDVSADQTVEINRMGSMLALLPPDEKQP